MAADYWSWRDRLAEGIDQRFWPITALDDLVVSGRAQFWGNEAAAVITEIKDFPTGLRAISVVIAAGDKQALIDELRPDFENWGRENGCGCSIVESRPGWARALRSHGYETFQVSIAKEL